VNLTNLIINTVFVAIIVIVTYEVVVNLKTRMANRKNKPQNKGENAFKGFARGQSFRNNFWSMVKAYRQRAIEKLGWNEE